MATTAVMTRAVSLLIKSYQWFISPVLPSRCRFYPSCSHYALQALEHYALARALVLIIKRLLRCQPFCRGGLDPLPMKEIS